MRYHFSRKLPSKTLTNSKTIVFEEKCRTVQHMQLSKKFNFCDGGPPISRGSGRAPPTKKSPGRAHPGPYGPVCQKTFVRLLQSIVKDKLKTCIPGPGDLPFANPYFKGCSQNSLGHNFFCQGLYTPRAQGTRSRSGPIHQADNKFLTNGPIEAPMGPCGPIWAWAGPTKYVKPF